MIGRSFHPVSQCFAEGQSSSILSFIKFEHENPGLQSGDEVKIS